MEIILCILCCIITTLLICHFIYKKDKYISSGLRCVVNGGLVGMFIPFSIILLYDHFNKPTAMDVYQGNTILEYNVVNGVKVDSVVIWKENVK